MITDNAPTLREIANQFEYGGPWRTALTEVAAFLEAGTDHYVVFTDGGWSIQHSLGCREENVDLTQCETHRTIQDWEIYKPPGRYKVVWHTTSVPSPEGGDEWGESEIDFEPADALG